MKTISDMRVFVFIAAVLAGATLPADAQEKPGDFQPSEGGTVVRMAEATPIRAVGDSLPGETEATPQEEIVVTAQKVQERELDVPMGITVLSGTDLAANHDLSFQDWVSKVPGLTLMQMDPGTNLLSIRGISQGVSTINAPVALYVDDTPYTSEGPFSNTGIAANLDPYDIARIEVLKGPQGTLYGANTLGGVIKYVTNAPDPHAFSASAETGYSSATGGAAGFDAHAMVNVPLGSSAALRLTAYDVDTPGYVDDPMRGFSDINGEHTRGGRLSVLALPTDHLSVRLSVVYQNITVGDIGIVDFNGGGSVNPSFGVFKDSEYFNQPEDIKNEILNLTVNYDAGWMTFLSSTSYAHTGFDERIDETAAFPFFPNEGTAEPFMLPVSAVTQELRLSGGVPQRFNWQTGLYFDREYAHEYAGTLPVDLTTQQPIYGGPDYGTLREETTYRELAGFANFDAFILPALDVALGARYSANHQSYTEDWTGETVPDLTFLQPSTGHVTTWSADVRYHLREDLMTYARAATGYAPGGANDTYTVPGTPLPTSYGPSTTFNYEAGVKGQGANGRFTVDLDVFDIRWRHIQLTELAADGLSDIANGGSAESRGGEWALTVVPAAGLSVLVNGAYTHARLAQDLPPPLLGGAGDPLAYIPNWTAYAAVDYEHVLWGNYHGFGGIGYRYSDNRRGEFPDVAPPRNLLPSYALIDLKAGLRNGAWTVTAYAKNLTNREVVTGIYDATFNGGAGEQLGITLPPRTVGLEIESKL